MSDIVDDLGHERQQRWTQVQTANSINHHNIPRGIARLKDHLDPTMGIPCRSLGLVIPPVTEYIEPSTRHQQ